MSMTIALASTAFFAGLIWGVRKPAGYCSMSREQQHGWVNRFGSGVINGAILAGIVAVMSFIVTG